MPQRVGVEVGQHWREVEYLQQGGRAEPGLQQQTQRGVGSASVEEYPNHPGEHMQDAQANAESHVIAKGDCVPGHAVDLVAE